MDQVGRFQALVIVPEGRTLEEVLAPHSSSADAAPWLEVPRREVIERGRSELLRPGAGARGPRRPSTAESERMLRNEDELYAWAARSFWPSAVASRAGILSTFNRRALYDDWWMVDDGGYPVDEEGLVAPDAWPAGHDEVGGTYAYLDASGEPHSRDDLDPDDFPDSAAYRAAEERFEVDLRRAVATAPPGSRLALITIKI